MQSGQLRRREFITLLGGAAASWPLAARAQQPAGNVPRIGLLWPGVTPPVSPRMESFRRGLREQGYVDGRNVIIELRYAQEGPQRLADHAAELVRMNVDVIDTAGDLAPKIAQQASRTIPIIAITDDILGAGLVANLSRPGGNVTGLSILAPELSAKRLEVLKSVFPAITRVAALSDSSTGTAQALMTSNAAQFLNVDLQILEIRSREDLAPAFEAVIKKRAEALNVFSSPFLSSLYREIIDLRRKNGCRLSTNGVSTWRLAVLCRMDLTLRRCGAKRPSWWQKFLEARIRVRCPSSSRRRSIWW
jgi:putative ABC transport system substrate-binding protein